MLLTTHDFRCHVSRSSARIGVIVGLDDPCNTEVSDSEVSFIIEDEVLGFNISMNDVVKVQKLEPN